MKPSQRFRSLGRWLGVTHAPVSHTERLVSALGGFVAIFSVLTISRWYIGSPGAEILVASMGASAVLLFAVPHGSLSQPWAVIGGHLVSALAGVSCAQLVGNEIVAASAAVGLAIGCMYYLKCIHPPGGATALVAVVGGEATRALGYGFVVAPVLLNVAVILGVAIAFNAFFSWRRYPAAAQFSGSAAKATGSESSDDKITHSDFVYALSQIDSFIDVNEHDLLRIYDLATKRSRGCEMAAKDIRPGHTYSNGAYGDEWSVRQIIDESPADDPARDMVIYKTVAGKGRRSSACITRGAFATWARHRVVRDEDNWKRAATDD